MSPPGCWAASAACCWVAAATTRPRADAQPEMPSFTRFLPDMFTAALVATVALASLLPVQGQLAGIYDGATDFAIALLFFLHGARLSRSAVLAGMVHWRLHLL